MIAKTTLAIALVAGTILVAGCATVTSLVTSGYNELCIDKPGAPSLLTSARAVPLNAQRTSDIADLTAICSHGVPTNAVTATADGLTAYALLKRDFPQLGLK
jgi:hypothetical protein